MQEVFVSRLWIFRVLIAIVFFVLLARLAYLQLYRGDYYQHQANENRIRSIPIEAPRGFIFDRNGVPLAENSTSFMVMAVPYEVSAHLNSLKILSYVLHIPLREILNKVFSSNASSLPVILKEHMDFKEFASLSEYLPLPGIYTIATPERKYLHPYRDAHLLGYVGLASEKDLKERKSEGLKMGDVVGKNGIEEEYDSLLRGTNGDEEVEVDAAGNFVKVLSEKQPVPGNNLYLTIDANLQETAWKAIKEELVVLKKRNGKRTPASVIALNPNNGEVLAYVSWPSFNANWFARGITEKEYQSLLNNPFDPLLNRPIQAAYPTGSTFKQITGSAALQTRVINPNKLYYCPGYFHIPGITFHCFVRSGHGWLKFPEAVAQSCDVYFYRAAYLLKIHKLDEYARYFGIGQLTGIDLPDEASGLLPTPAWKQKTLGMPWFPADTISFGIGQGYLQATPMQMAVVTSIVANGGTYWRPHLFLRAVSQNGSAISSGVPRYPHFVRTVPVSQKNLALLRLGMFGAVDHGTATAAQVKGIPVAGKTGTAENFPTPLNPKGRNHAWFVCFAPYYPLKKGDYIQKPQIVVVVMLEQSGGYGGEFAAPIAQKILTAFFKERKELASRKPLADDPSKEARTQKDD
jgi:penicillin-binding protein 2